MTLATLRHSEVRIPPADLLPWLRQGVLSAVLVVIILASWTIVFIELSSDHAPITAVSWGCAPAPCHTVADRSNARAVSAASHLWLGIAGEPLAAPGRWPR